MTGSLSDISHAKSAAPLKRLVNYLELCKLHLGLYIFVSAVFGYVTASAGLSGRALLVGGGVFLLAAGCAVLNNIQDRFYDRYFLRTCGRALAQKKIQPFHAAVFAVVLISTGLYSLFELAGWRAMLLGLLALVFYNGFYTPLKKISLYAILPGSVCGMLPPAIGWAAAGGKLDDPLNLTAMTIFCLWQIPHFFIILLKNSRSDKHLKTRGTYPSFLQVFTGKEMKLLTLIWSGLYSLGLLLYVLKGGMIHTVFSAAAVLNGMVLCLVLVWALMPNQDRPGHAFAVVNFSMLLFMAAGVADRMML